jgi:ribosomal protein S27AE
MNIRTRLDRLEHRRKLDGQGCPECARGVGLAVVIEMPGEPPRPVERRACSNCGRVGVPFVIHIRREGDGSRL